MAPLFVRVCAKACSIKCAEWARVWKIFQEYAKVYSSRTVCNCKSVTQCIVAPRCARVYWSIQDFEKVSESVQKHTTMCKSVTRRVMAPQFARLNKSPQDFEKSARVCKSSVQVCEECDPAYYGTAICNTSNTSRESDSSAKLQMVTTATFKGQK